MTVRPTPISRTKAFKDIAEIVSAFPDAFAAEQIPLLRQLAPQILAIARAGVPVRKGPRPLPGAGGEKWRAPGGLVSLLDAKVDEQARRLSVGLLTADTISRGFYGYILDAGRGQRRSRSRPRVRTLKGTRQVGRATLGRFSIRYTRAISPIAPDRYDITFGRARAAARDLAGPLLLVSYERMVLKLAWKTVVGA